jgi:hypothetical protein
MPQNRYWRPDGNDPLPTPAEALNEMFSAFPSWFLRIECDRCGKVVMINEVHATTPLRGRPLSEILDLFRHDKCHYWFAARDPATESVARFRNPNIIAVSPAPSSHTGQSCCSRITGMRSCSSAISAFGVVVRMVNVRVA